ncbi:hypothetical protein NPIL_256461 [Nephila pilipes]|uniref:Uncharacterized protein n=1 Tax=Nephila pilipes TaxID=299642 RepID=A0A8X6UJL8_NEPPI|nr:hypothetical protein NPIL_256461 [Nephila pilipes]
MKTTAILLKSQHYNNDITIKFLNTLINNPNPSLQEIKSYRRIYAEEFKRRYLYGSPRLVISKIQSTFMHFNSRLPLPYKQPIGKLPLAPVREERFPLLTVETTVQTELLFLIRQPPSTLYSPTPTP